MTFSVSPSAEWQTMPDLDSYHVGPQELRACRGRSSRGRRDGRAGESPQRPWQLGVLDGCHDLFDGLDVCGFGVEQVSLVRQVSLRSGAVVVEIVRTGPDRSAQTVALRSSAYVSMARRYWCT